MLINSRLIIDSGAIVAAIHDRDQWHLSARKFFSELPKPFYTCEPAVAEACHLLKNISGGVNRILGLVSSEALRLDFLLSKEINRVCHLTTKYQDVPMSLTDACLVRMSEIHKDSVVFTFDWDFQIYRRNVRERIFTIPDFK